MPTFSFLLSDEDATNRLGTALARQLRPRDVVAWPPPGRGGRDGHARCLRRGRRQRKGNPGPLGCGGRGQRSWRALGRHGPTALPADRRPCGPAHATHGAHSPIPLLPLTVAGPVHPGRHHPDPPVARGHLAPGDDQHRCAKRGTRCPVYWVQWGGGDTAARAHTLPSPSARAHYHSTNQPQQARSGTSRTASRPSSRPFPACRRCASRTSWSATSPSSWAMPTPKSTGRPTPRCPGRGRTRRTGRPRRTRPRATCPATRAPAWSCCAMCHSLTAPATTSSWPPCSTAPPSWMAPCCWSPPTRPAPSPRRRSTWRRWKSCASSTSSSCKTRLTSSPSQPPPTSTTRSSASCRARLRRGRPSSPSPPSSSTTWTRCASTSSKRCPSPCATLCHLLK